jgi:hypothetical protein
MKLEFLPDLTDGGKYKQVVAEKIVRLYDFDHKEATFFREVLQETVIRNKQKLDLASLPFVEAINCNLVFDPSDRDVGIETENGSNFICELTMEAYKSMVYLLEPFCDANNHGSGYNWLYKNYDIGTNIHLLFSPGGTW